MRRGASVFRDDGSDVDIMPMDEGAASAIATALMRLPLIVTTRRSCWQHTAKPVSDINGQASGAFFNNRTLGAVCRLMRINGDPIGETRFAL